MYKGFETIYHSVIIKSAVRIYGVSEKFLYKARSPATLK